MFEFAMKYFRKKRENETNLKLSFIDGHPLFDTHCLGKRYDEVVPVLQGFRLPDNSEEASLEKRCKYAVLSLVLFKPFRGLETLIGDSEATEEQVWINSFERWKPQRSEFVRTIMENMDDYHSGLEKAKCQSEIHTTAREANDGEDSDCNLSDDSDELFPADQNIDGDSFERVFEEDGADRNLLSHLWNFDGATDIVLESSALDPAACATSPLPEKRISSMIDVFKNRGILQNAAETLVRDAFATCPLTRLPPIEVMKKWVKDLDTDNALAPVVSTSGTAQDVQIIELLDDSLGEVNTEWQPSARFSSDPKLRKSFATISDTSKAFTLNNRQHYAFKAIGAAMLSRWRRGETLHEDGFLLESVLRKTQLLMFLGGEGGTGKSRIVDAVQALCESWERPQCLVKTALTGKAATLIGGRTLAGFLLQIRKKRATDALANLDFIIYVEVSMLKKFQLTQVDRRLRNAKRVPDVAFGGVHIVLIGDFLQLPPVGGDPIYKDPSTKARPSADEIAGFHLWCEFKTVVILKECVRFRKDPEWGQGCQQARLGIWTPAFVDLINSRVLASESSLDDAVIDGTFGTFVTPDNSTRIAINNLFISTAAKLLPDGDYPVRVVANFKNKLSALRRSEVRMLMSLPDTKYCRMAPYLDLILGMPIQVTQNIRAAKLVSNGTLGRLEAIIYHPNTRFRLVYDSAADMTVKVPSVAPAAVIVRIQRGPSATAMLGCSGTDFFQLFFDTQAYVACSIAFASSINGVPRSLSVRIQQFPLVCAVSSTIYKVQGETLDGMVVIEWWSKGAVANKREQPYLLVSRVTSRDAFATLTPLTADIIEWAHPSKAALAEEARLERLSCRTIEKLKKP